jgi:hypothetical protein
MRRFSRIVSQKKLAVQALAQVKQGCAEASARARAAAAATARAHHDVADAAHQLGAAPEVLRG